MPATSVARNRLRRRFVATLLSLTLGSAVLLSLGFWASERFVESNSLRSLLERDMRDRLEQNLPPPARNHQGDTLLYYRPALGGEPPPPALATLPIGSYAEVHIAGEDYIVLVREAAGESGDRAWLAYSDAARERREQLLFSALAFGVLLTALAGTWVARRLARQAVAPLDSLVVKLQGLDPEQRQQRLSPPPADSELAVIVEALNGYMGRLDELVERERAFAAAASHELRTPLAIIRGAAEVLGEQQPALKPVGRIHRAALAAQRDLDALLWLSRPGEPADFESLALHERLPALCDNQVDTAAVRWQLEPCAVSAPAGAVSVIVSNLLRNSLRAAPQAGGVRVALTATQLTVEDDGPGVPLDELPHVFDPRTRGRDGGTGMGLYIARILAERLGWQLTLDNRPEGGAVAQLRFSTR